MHAISRLSTTTTITKTTTTTTRSLATLVQSKISPNILEAQYAVRGEIVQRAQQLQQKLAQGESLPFKKIVMCNIGNPQSLGQKPISFVRQVLAGCVYPELTKSGSMLPSDARERAARILDSTDDYSIGAYTHSQGLLSIREDVCNFLFERDGIPEQTDSVFLTDGASPGIKTILNLMISHPRVGVMIPIPQYPLYSASISLAGGIQVPYYLHEESGWSLDSDALEESYLIASKAGVEIRAICVINPGNPTGQCLTLENLRHIISFAQKHNLVILADEVYQQNVYHPEKSFYSFRKVLHSMGSEGEGVELVSFHSTSKGMLGECGMRGGYMQLTNIQNFAQQQLYKLASISLCPNVCGQVVTSVMVCPPKEGSESYELFAREMGDQFASLRRRAEMTTKVLNGVSCIHSQPADGAMYAFPKIILPPKAIHAAKIAGKSPDTFFCLELLNSTGVCVVPGSGFGQRDGTFHFRTTILPPESELEEVMRRLAGFAEEFCAKYA